MKKRVLFISNVKPLSGRLSSTDIMTINLIEGLSKCNVDLSLLILTDNSDIADLYKDYQQYANNIIVSKRQFHEGQSIFKSVFGSLFNALFPGFYKKNINVIQKNNSLDYDIVISNKITIDEIFYGAAIKNKNPNVTFIQYWSDPMALSGINIGLFKKSPKKWVFRITENRCLKSADKIVYGTKILYLNQKAFYSRHSIKMSYIDISYTNKKMAFGEKNENKILYAGNFFTTIRNISPLVEAISSQKKFILDIYGDGDFDVSLFDNVNCHGRIKKEALDKISIEYKYIICILNRISPQIPGKIFYDMYSKQKIIVLVDGPMIKETTDYLNTYQRFILCNNDAKEIKKMLEKIETIECNVDLDFLDEHYSPVVVAKTLIEGGMK